MVHACNRRGRAAKRCVTQWNALAACLGKMASKEKKKRVSGWCGSSPLASERSCHSGGPALHDSLCEGVALMRQKKKQLHGTRDELGRS